MGDEKWYLCSHSPVNTSHTDTLLSVLVLKSLYLEGERIVKPVCNGHFIEATFDRSRYDLRYKINLCIAPICK